MADTNFQPLFEYLDDKLGDLKTDIKEIDKKVDTLQTSVDGLTKIVKDFQDEHIILRRKVELLETWARQVSEKVGIPLPTELFS
jgi:archaellum component FlaC